MSEHEEQAAVVQYVKAKYPKVFPFLFSVPNGMAIGGRNKFALVNKFKREGLSVGYPDLGLDWPTRRYHGLRIEMKPARGPRGGKSGVLSQEQIGWLSRLTGVGYLAEVCYGADEAIELIDEYLSVVTQLEKRSEAVSEDSP